MRDLVHHRRHLEKNDDSVPNRCHFFMSAILLRIRIRVTLLTPEGEIACVTAAPHSKSQKYTKNKKLQIRQNNKNNNCTFHRNISMYKV